MLPAAGGVLPFDGCQICRVLECQHPLPPPAMAGTPLQTQPAAGDVAGLPAGGGTGTRGQPWGHGDGCGDTGTATGARGQPQGHGDGCGGHGDIPFPLEHERGRPQLAWPRTCPVARGQPQTQRVAARRRYIPGYCLLINLLIMFCFYPRGPAAVLKCQPLVYAPGCWRRDRGRVPRGHPVPEPREPGPEAPPWGGTGPLPPSATRFPQGWG